MDDFEQELESELHRILDPIAGAPIPSRRAAGSGGTMKKLLGGVGAAIGVKLLTGIAVAAAAVTVAAAATEVASTGSVNPAAWGRQVSQQVQTCKDTLRASGTRGIGQCVSQLAGQNGQAHRATDAGGQGHGNTNAGDNSNANANGVAKDKTKTQSDGSGNSNGSSSGKDPQSSAGEPTDPVMVPTHPLITPQP